VLKESASPVDSKSLFDCAYVVSKVVVTFTQVIPNHELQIVASSSTSAVEQVQFHEDDDSDDEEIKSKS
jgi:hypothetical protein